MSSRRSTASFVSTAIQTREGAALGERDDVPTLFPVVEAILMPPILRTQATTQASTTTVHLGSKRAVSADKGDVGSW